MSLAERFNQAGEKCYKIAGSRTMLVGAFAASVVVASFSPEIAVGCLGAPAAYGTIGFANKVIARGVQLFSPTE